MKIKRLFSQFGETHLILISQTLLVYYELFYHSTIYDYQYFESI